MCPHPTLLLIKMPQSTSISNRCAFSDQGINRTGGSISRRNGFGDLWLGRAGIVLQNGVASGKGDIINQRDILRRLAEMQYTRNDIELRRATYRVRGEVIDIFPAESEQEALRIELFDDEVERLSLFDPLTGEIIRRLARYTVYPKSHYVTPREQLLSAVEAIKIELIERLKQLRSLNKLVEAQRLGATDAV